MTATAAQIAQLRKMVNEPTEATYTDEDIQAAIERYPLMDANGIDPTYMDYSTQPPTPTANEDWIPTYDMNAAAADIWDEKASVRADDFDFQADGGSYSRSQTYEHASQMARKYRARRAMRHTQLVKSPLENQEEEV